ncbi:restriction endonuclease subunit S [candidate division KSB1 bacterium]|nr:restriction endonuclease subunit S [candidate division KSB1 bacterium]
MTKETKFKQTEARLLSEWSLITINDIASRVNTGLDAIRRAPIINKNTGLKCLRIQDISQDKDYDRWGFTRVTDNDLDKYKLKRNDILIARTGASIGVKKIIKEDLNAVFNNGLIRIKVDSKKCVPQYLYYNLCSEKYDGFIENISGGTSTQPNMQINALLNFTFCLPPFQEQIAIAKILSDLDAKIELLQRQNETLKQIGAAIFKHWFIDFEFPDEHGKPYKSSGGEMVDSELGEIPKGWEIDTIFKIADMLSGGTPKTQILEYWDGNIPWVSAKDVSDSRGTFILNTERKIKSYGVEKSNAKLLPIYTTIITARGTIGNYCILSQAMTINQTNYGFKSKIDNSDFFVFYLISSSIKLMQRHAYGTIFDTITTSTFRNLPIIVPPISIIEYFNKNISKLMIKILTNLREIDLIIDIRDSLLPKLMSGKIRVPLDYVANR